MAGFNFRATDNYVADGVGETYVLTSDTYPTSRGGFTFGWDSSPVGSNNRSSSVDRRLAGIARIDDNSPKIFATNSGSGVFNVTIAVGDVLFSNSSRVSIIEVNDSQVEQSVLAVIANNESLSGGEFFDATSVIRTSPADWVANNATLEVTVADGNNLAVRVGPSSPSGGESFIAHFAYESAVTPPSITNVNTTNEVTDGQQNVPVVVSGFAGDITSMSLRVGADTLALTGLTGTGDNYTIDFPDISAFVADTAGLPFSSTAYQVELLATDGTDTAAINITLEPKAGWEVVETVSAVDTEGSIFETRTGGAPFDGSQIYYPNAGNTTISATGIIQTDLNTMSGVLWDVTSKTWETFTVNINVVNDTNYVKPIVNSIVRPIVNSIINHKV